MPGLDPLASPVNVLLVDGVRCGLRLRRAASFAARLIGFWPSPRRHDVEAIEFPHCRAVHTFGMTEAIDVVFVDAGGRVLRVVARLAPWRLVREPDAQSVFEFRAGHAAPLGVVAGARLHSEWATVTSKCHRVPGRSQRGSAMIEFSLAMVLVVLPMVSAILEFAQLAVTRQLLGYAVSEAARSAAITAMDAASVSARVAETEGPTQTSIRMSLARGLLPVLGGDFESATETDEGLLRWGGMVIEAMRQDRLSVVFEADVLSSADIVVGRLNVTYCRELFFPPASYLLPNLMRLWTDDLFAQACLLQGRVPIEASAPVSRSRYP
ncbi:MAG: DUF192 domain-containing protein [Gammaproteobacteria bacterium]|nr:DUF192 domain-containing protein [Gammaproteobacteria bacterium]